MMTFKTFRTHLTGGTLSDAEYYNAPYDHIVRLDGIAVRTMLIHKKRPTSVITDLSGKNFIVNLNRKRNWELYKMVKVI